jgi:methyl-accepting chemotaxis protein
MRLPAQLGLQQKLAAILTLFGVVPLVAVFIGYSASIKPRIQAQSFATFEVDSVSLGAVLNREILDRMMSLEAAIIGHPSAQKSELWRSTDPEGALAGILNGDMRAGLYKLMMLVDPKGGLLGVNTKDSAGKSVRTAALYDMNFAGEPWFKDVVEGRFTYDTGLVKVSMLPFRREPAVAKAYGDEGWVMPFAAPLRAKDGSIMAVWVDFLDVARFDQHLKADATRMDTTLAGDIKDADLRLEILDASNKLLAAFQQAGTNGNSLGREIIGREADRSAASLLTSLAGEKTLQSSVIGDEAITASLAPPARGFNSGWRVVIRAPASQAFATANSITTNILVALGITAALALAIGIWTGRGFSRPIVAIGARMRTLSAGDNETPIPHAEKRDEIGDMARAVAIFRDNALALISAEAAAAESGRQTEAERARNEASRAREAANQALVVRSVAQGLSRLSDGDLTYRLDEAFAAEYEQLRSDFNAAMDQLQETMRVISRNTSGIKSGTSEISQAADDLSRRTEQQAASLEETAAALDQITATVRKTAEGANHARQAVSTTKSDAERSGEIVGSAVAAMGEIEKSSGQISQIIGVIDEIAFQTNLLALNAGVEAARAGEAGKGFAVVASEVRALAQRSAEAAKEIKGLIQASTTHVGSGVELVGQTGKALERIVTQVAEINGIVSEIAASAQEQSTGLAEVNTAVNQMDQLTQQNAAMVEQSTAASHSLAQEADALAALVGRFQLGDDSAPAASPIRKAQPAKPAAPAKPARRSMLQALTGRGSSVAVKEAPAEAGWEEF